MGWMGDGYAGWHALGALWTLWTLWMLWMLWMLLWWLLPLGLFALLMKYLIGGAGNPNRQASQGKPGAARALLDERYVKGEIERTEYQQKCADLSRE